MVVFTCNHCGESLQKPKVEKHYSFVCRRNKCLTCVDCLKDFNGEEYATHTKCMTEEERYAAKGTYKNGIVKKGEVKQEQWSDMIRSILQDSNNFMPKCKNLLNHIVNFTNVPRKKVKFMNFMKNTMGGRVDIATVEEVWNIIEQHKNKTATNVTNQINGTPASDLKKCDLKRKNNENDVENNKKVKTEIGFEKSETDITTENKEEAFQMADEILKVLNKKESLTFKKLQKKILKKYKASKGDINTEKFDRKFNKKLKKIPNVIIEGDIVSLRKK